MKVTPHDVKISFKDRRRWLHGAIPLAACLLAAALLNPYLRAHGFWGSPVFGIAWAAALTGIPILQRRRWWERAGTAATCRRKQGSS